MEFLGIGPLELLFVAIILLLVLGPGQLERTLRTVGEWIYRFNHSGLMRELRQARQLPRELLRDTGLEETARDLQTWNKQMGNLGVYPETDLDKTIHSVSEHDLPEWTTPRSRPVGLTLPAEAPGDEPPMSPKGLAADDLDLSAWTTLPPGGNTTQDLP